MNVLGIESTAHTLGIGIVNEGRVLANERSMFEPEEGGIHPRKAAEHHYQNALDLIKRTEAASGLELSDVDAVAFAQGPGIPQCLDIGAVMARSIASNHQVPLIGVNHCLAHISIGTRTTEAADPTTLYLSGGNSQILELRSGRYRIIGETLDIALGNALDKLARTMGYPHPGGPKIEELASGTDDIIELSYPVKGMDFSFSGLTTECERKVNSVEDSIIANSFQEHAYAAVVEALERAMAQEGSEEALLTGGVAMNDRLREMVETMCDERGATFYVPDKEYCMDNGAMIAHQGLLELKAGGETKTRESAKRPDWRPDEVEAVWKES